MDTKSREQFERWFLIEFRVYVSGYGRSAIFVLSPDGYYLCDKVESAWKGYHARAAQDKAALEEVREALTSLFRDMKLRIDTQEGLAESYRTCGGYKDKDGVYVFPWGNGVNHALNTALNTLDKLMGDA